MTKPQTTWALIPIKARGEGKSRLADVLSADKREALVEAMLRHVVEATKDARTIAHRLLVGTSRHGIDQAVPLLAERGRGLNAALENAFAQIAAAPDCPDRLIIVAADLPCLTPLDLDLLATMPDRTVAIAPDRHGTGTNALSLPLPEATAFRFHYGSNSAVQHRCEAQRLGLKVEAILSHGLQKDIDEPSDLMDAAQIIFSDR